MKKIILLFFICFACRERVILQPIPFEGEKLVVFSYLNPSEEISVWVLKTGKPQFDLNQNLIVANASVSVFKNNMKIEDLTYAKDGQYKTNIGLKPELDGFYHIEVEVPNLKKAVSAQVKIPQNNLLISSKSTRNLNPEVNANVPQNWIETQFNNNKNIEGYYVYGLKAVYAKNDLTTEFWDENYLSENLNKCSQRISMPYNEKSISGYYFTNDCFAENKLNFRQSLQLTNNQLRASEIELYSIAITKDFYQFLKNKDQPDDIERIFKDPTTTFTNIKNGYGIVAGINWNIKTIDL